jgi:hypothetical protein
MSAAIYSKVREHVVIGERVRSVIAEQRHYVFHFGQMLVAFFVYCVSD